MDKNKEVYVTKIENENYYRGISDLFDSMNVEKNDDIEKICIKINLCDYRLPSSGATTDPLILDALLEVLQEKFVAAKIYILENDASGTNVDNLFYLLKINEIADKYSCEIKNLAKEKWITKKINGLYFDEIEIPKIIEECDLLINHPKLKTHGLTKVTVGLKNIFGCIHDKYKVKYHNKIDEVIVDINKAIKCDYCIVDGNICLEGIEGPSYGFPKKCGLVIGGNNVVSVDSFCARLMGFNPWFVPHIRKAHFNSLGSVHYNLHTTNFDNFSYKDYKFRFNIWQYYMLRLLRGKL